MPKRINKVIELLEQGQPVYATSVEMIRANTWMFKQALATGVPGILLCHANEPEAVKLFEAVTAERVTASIDEGSRRCGCSRNGEEIARIGRAYTNP